MFHPLIRVRYFTRPFGPVAIQRQVVMKDEEKYGKTIVPAHLYATGKGLAIVEFKNQKQIANRMAFGAPDGKTGVKYKIMPLIEGSVYQASLAEIRK